MGRADHAHAAGERREHRLEPGHDHLVVVDEDHPQRTRHGYPSPPRDPPSRGSGGGRPAVLASPGTRGALVPDKALRIRRAGVTVPRPRPVMLAIAGDSAAGKTTMTRGLVEALGPERCVSLCTDDYHRYDREERRELPFTALHPDGNHLEIMEQHLQLLATGAPVLKPVYDHATGRLVRPELVEPAEFVIVEGLFPLWSRLSRACFDVTVFLDPPEEIRRGWKVRATPASVATPRRRCSPSWSVANPSRRPDPPAARGAPTSSCGSRRSRAATIPRARPLSAT